MTRLSVYGHQSLNGNGVVYFTSSSSQPSTPKLYKKFIHSDKQSSIDLTWFWCIKRSLHICILISPKIFLLHMVKRLSVSRRICTLSFKVHNQETQSNRDIHRHNTTQNGSNRDTHRHNTKWRKQEVNLLNWHDSITNFLTYIYTNLKNLRQV